MAPRTILYTGKGGVGKTSVAAATARRCAAAGMRTVVLSTDPAHSLSDSLETEFGSTPVPCGDNLWGQEVQAQEEMERHWDAVQEWMGDMLAERGVDRIAAEELTVPPGMDELFSLLQIKRHHEADEFDAIVVDCAPTGETLRLLSFPDVASWWLEKVFPIERRLMAAARPFARTLLDVSLPPERVFDDVERLVQNLVAMNVILRNRATTSIRLVMNPDRMVIREAMRTYTYLNLYGYLTDAVVVNRVFPEEVENGYFAGWRAHQQEQMELVRSAFAPVPILTAPFFAEEVVAPRCSTAWATRCSRTTTPRGCCTTTCHRSSCRATGPRRSGSRSRSRRRATSTSRRSASRWSCGSAARSGRSSCLRRWRRTARGRRSSRTARSA